MNLFILFTNGCVLLVILFIISFCHVRACTTLFIRITAVGLNMTMAAKAAPKCWARRQRMANCVVVTVLQ